MADAKVVPTVASRKRRRVNPSFVFWFSPSGEEFFMTFSVEAGLCCARDWLALRI
jgi:hypothetical protein